MSQSKPHTNGNWIFWAGFLWIAAMGVLLHFTYAWSGNHPFVALFSAVNESVWEHLKLLFFPAAVFSGILTCMLHRKYPALLTAYAVATLLAMVLQVALFYTYSGILGSDVVWVDIGIFLLCAAVASALGWSFCKRWKQTTGSLWGLAIFTLLSICFFRFTKQPPALGIFQVP